MTHSYRSGAMFPALALADRIQNLRARQGATPVESTLLTGQVLFYAPHQTQNKGANTTYVAAIDGIATRCFHKTFAGVDAAVAHTYGQSPDTAPIHECAAWFLARALGTPYDALLPPCVLRELSNQLGSLIVGIVGTPHQVAPVAPGHPQGTAAGFFDALIGQQDRHPGNFRWDAAANQLHLIDQGFAFAGPGDYLNASVFVDARWRANAQALTAPERATLTALVASPDLYGLAAILESPRADDLLARAKRMLARGEILKPGDF